MVKPSDFPRAIAHTASKSPDTISTTHAMVFAYLSTLFFVVLKDDPLVNTVSRTQYRPPMSAVLDEISLWTCELKLSTGGDKMCGFRSHFIEIPQQ